MTRTQIQQASQEASRPMKWDSAEEIALSFSRAAMKKHNGLTRDFLSIFSERDIPGWASLQRLKVLTPTESCCDPVEKRDDRPSDVAMLTNQLAAYLTRRELQEIESLFKRYESEFFSPQNMPNSSVFGRYIPEAWQDGYDQSYLLLSKLAGENVLEEAIRFNITNRYFGEYLTVAYSRVTSKVSSAAKGLFLRSMYEGLQGNLPWQEIAQSVYRRAGIGALWHWKRLVRTEMVFAHTFSFMDTYQKAGIEYVFYSPSMSACTICAPDRGYWRMSDVPQPPRHPNCRCMLTPVRDLPQGAELR